MAQRSTAQILHRSTNMSTRLRSASPNEKQTRRESLDRGGEYRKRKKDRGQDRYSDEESSKESKDLPHHAKPLSDADYFLKNAELRAWLKEEKDRVCVSKKHELYERFI